MEVKKGMKKLNKLEKYVAPNLSFVGGFIYDGKDIDLCDDNDEQRVLIEETSDEKKEEVIDKIHIRQIIENDILKTQIEHEYKRRNGKWVRDNIYQEVEIEKNSLLVYLQGKGFVVNEQGLTTIDKTIELYKCLKGEKNDSSRTNKKHI